MVHKWILPTLSEVLALSELSLKDCSSPKPEWTVATENCGGDITFAVPSTSQTASEWVKAEREWFGAIAALEQLLVQSIDSGTACSADNHLPATQGLVFAGPVPVLSHTALLSSLSTWIFTAESLKRASGTLFQLPPATAMPTAQPLSKSAELLSNAGSILPLLPDDPLSNEQFCLILTDSFSFVMVLGHSMGTPAFLFSFEPEVVEQAWQSLRARVVLSSPDFPLSQLDALVERYYPVTPDYRTVTQFSRLLLKHLPESPVEERRGRGAEELAWGLNLRESKGAEESLDIDSHRQRKSTERAQKEHSSPRPDVELLQAFAHEVRTPLTTIRTLTRLLLKRRDLAPEVIKRLEIIDHECTEQIDRMELLFRAAELETSTVKHTSAHLTAMSLSQVLQQSIPRWQKQASRRNLTLDVVLPQQLPTVVSDPGMLDQVLTGLIENFTRSLPAGSHIQVQVIPAGDQLKLQLLPQCQPEESGKTAEQFPAPPTRKSLGQLLMFQPETGNISLNLTATKHLFQAIGGKLIVRQRPQQGEVLTIFLPVTFSHS